MPSLELTSEQADNLSTLFDFAKSFASPVRLAIIGWLAAHPQESIKVEEITNQIKIIPTQLEKELNQLSEAGIIRIDEWLARPGSEPQPARISFNTEYTKSMPRLVTTLAQLNNQLQPAEKTAKLDERSKTIGRFLQDGKLIGWPSQYKRQLYLLEEIAKFFEPTVHYSERQIDTILKGVYAYDHCMLRRALVDLGYLQRENGIYRKAGNQLSAV